MENRSLSAQNESLRQAITEKDDGRKMLIAAPIDEFFSGEQYDLVVTTLAKSLRTTETNTRAYELLEGILALTGKRYKYKKFVPDLGKNEVGLFIFCVTWYSDTFFVETPRF